MPLGRAGFLPPQQPQRPAKGEGARGVAGVLSGAGKGHGSVASCPLSGNTCPNSLLASVALARFPGKKPNLGSHPECF